MRKTESFLIKGHEAILSRMVRNVAEAIDSPRSLAVWLLFSNNEHRQLLDLECRSGNYTNADRFADDYLITSLLSKYPFLSTGIDTKAAAMDSFAVFEEQCRVTNRELSHRLHSNERVSRIIWAASEKCKKWLPVLVPQDDIPGERPLDSIFRYAQWGPGVTSAVKGSALAAYKKFQGNLEATPDLIAAGIHHLVNSIPMWSTYHASGTPDNPSSVTPNAIESVPGNAVTVVPKNAKTDRTIAVEPHLNAFLQRGVGIFLRKILKSHGTDLRSQERNQLLALRGSRDGSLATLDLKGASDTISREIVRTILPADWCNFLEVLRSPVYQRDGKWYRYHKHSSMGNGYTFELETLIFVLLAISVCNELGLSTKDVSVYGDDIIVPVEAYDLLVETLETCGFTVNSKKSFSSGLFRESCGKDYFDGINVRPFFVREKLSSVVALFRVANGLRRYCAMRLNGMGYDARFKRAWKDLFFSCPPAYRFRIPEGYGDGGFVSEWDEAAPALTVPRDGSGWRGRVIEFSARSRQKKNRCLSVASALYDLERMGWSPSSRVSSPLTSVDRTAYDLREKGDWRIRSARYTEWTGVGGWI